MNHYRQYSNLIKKAQLRDNGAEKHHIFPRSIFGENDKVVSLTMREHFVAHKLLFHICKKRYGVHRYTYKMANAVRLMCNRTSREYETARKYFIENHHTKTEEGRKHLSERLKGNQHTKGMKLCKHSTERVENNRQKHNKTYDIYFADGTIRRIVGAKAFAEQNGYNHSHLIQVVKGNRKRHKDIIGGKKVD